MELSVNSIGKKAASKMKVSAAFEREFNEPLIHQLIVSYQAGARQGSKAQKNRSDARGGGAKPWRQKGTGRARAGTRRSPIWVGGGRTFAAKPRDYSQKVNKKAYRAGMQSIVAELVRQDRLIVLDELKVAAPKTKELKTALDKLSVENVLIVADKVEDNLRLAARNLPHVNTCDVVRLNPLDLVSHEKVVMTVSAVKHLEEAWS